MIKIVIAGILATVALLLISLPGSVSVQATSSSDDGESVQITVKYLEESLESTEEKDQTEEIDQRIKDKLNKYTIQITPVYEISENDTEEYIDRVNERFPERAKRAPDTVEIPNLSLIKRISVNEEYAGEVLDILQTDPDFEYAVIKPRIKPTVQPDDPFYTADRSSSGSTSDTWALRKINMNPTDDGNSDSGWDTTTGSSDLVVAVYGTGIDYTHPDLADNVWVNPGEDLDDDGEVWDLDDINGFDDDGNGYADDLMGWNFAGNNNDIYDDGSIYGGHDTTVAGIIAAVGNNGIGSTGVAWDVKIMPIKNYGVGYEEAIQYAIENGADVVNISWAAYCGQIKDIVDTAHAMGTIVVVSSANDGKEWIEYSKIESRYMWIVGATDRNDNRYSFSNYGPRLDFTAPGGGVFGTIPTEVKATGLYTTYPILSVAQNASGNPAVAFFDPENNAFKYAVRNGGDWDVETIESGEWSGIYPSLGFDSDEDPHVSFYDWDDRVLKYAVKSDGSWDIQTLTDADDQGYHTSLAIGAYDEPRISFLDGTNNALKLAVYDGADWSIEDIESVGSVDLWYSSTSLAIDSLGYPHISFWHGINKDLGYANKITGSWEVEYPDTSGDVGYFSEIALDSSDDPHIVHADGSDWNTKYSHYDGVWYTETLLSAGTSGYLSNRIAIDSMDDPYVTTQNIPALGLYVFYNDGSGWSSEIIGESESLGYVSDFELLNNTTPFLVSTNRTEWLYEAEKSGSWEYSQITDWGSPYTRMGGTSAAAPLAAGLAALMIEEHPDWTLDEIYWAVASSAEDINAPGYDKYTGWGRIDADAALDVTEPLEDETPPTAQITFPEDGSAVDLETIEIAGTAADDNFVYYNLYYKKSSSSSWNTISGCNRDQITEGILDTWDVSGLETAEYDIRLETFDFYQSSTAEVTFFKGPDNPPSITLTETPSDPTSDSTPLIEGKAQSNQAFWVSSVEFQADGTDGEWSNCTPDDGEYNYFFERFTCSVDSSLDDGEHIIYIRASINTGATNPDDEAETASFTVDTGPPTNGSVEINGGDEYTLEGEVTLELYAEDQTTEVEEMIISGDESFDGASWEEYSTTVGYTLSSSDGEKMVFAKFKDAAGNESDAVTDAILLNTLAPSVITQAVPEVISVQRVSIQGTASDSVGEVTSVEYKFDSLSWEDAAPDDGVFNEVEEDFSFSVGDLDEGLEEGSHSLWVRATDSYGVTTPEVMYMLLEFTNDLSPPTFVGVVSETLPDRCAVPTFYGTVGDLVSVIVSVQYRVDDGNWKDATPADGVFDEAEEEYVITPDNLDEGTHRLEIRAIDAGGLVAGISDYRFSVFGSNDTPTEQYGSRRSSNPQRNAISRTVVPEFQDLFVLEELSGSQEARLSDTGDSCLGTMRNGVVVLLLLAVLYSKLKLIGYYKCNKKTKAFEN